jgi:hypothetical protein
MVKLTKHFRLVLKLGIYGALFPFLIPPVSVGVTLVLTFE